MSSIGGSTSFRPRTTRRHFIGAAVAGVAGGILGTFDVVPPGRAVAAAGGALTITSFGGTFQKTVESEVVVPFERQFGARVSIVTGTSVNTLSRLETAKGHPDIDVAFMDLAPMYIARRRHLLQKLDLSKIPSARLLYPVAVDREGYWLGELIAMTGIAYNTDKVKVAPNSWLDLWDPAFKGHVAIPDVAQTAGYEFLVEAARLHGGGETNIDPGFEAIKKLKPSIVSIYKDPDGISQLLTSGDAWVGPWYNDRFNQLKKAGAPVGFVKPKEGAIAIVSTMSVPAGAPNPELAMRFIDFFLSTPIETAWANRMQEGPTNWEARLSAALSSAEIPHGTDVGKLISLDMNTVSQRLPDWISRWQREIVG